MRCKAAPAPLHELLRSWPRKKVAAGSHISPQQVSLDTPKVATGAGVPHNPIKKVGLSNSAILPISLL